MADLLHEFFTEVRDQDGRRWVRLDEVAKILPDDAGAQVFDPAMIELLKDGLGQGVVGCVVLWQKETNEMSTISSTFDCAEIAEALEHAAKKYRDPDFVRERGVVDLS